MAFLRLTFLKKMNRSGNFFSRAMICMIRFYQKHISGKKKYCHCIYTPTCSEYAVEAIERYGAGKGFLLAVRRILRCHPFAGGGYDPVP